MSKNFSKTLAKIFFLLILVSLIVPQPTEAINVQVTNKYSDSLNVALVYFEDASNRWIVTGWFPVDPYSTRDLNFNNSTRMNSVYIHAYTSEATWGTERKYTVISDIFKYFAGEHCPDGIGKRQVGFDRYYMENNGYVYFRP